MCVLASLISPSVCIQERSPSSPEAIRAASGGSCVCQRCVLTQSRPRFTGQDPNSREETKLYVSREISPGNENLLPEASRKRANLFAHFFPKVRSCTYVHRHTIQRVGKPNGICQLRRRRRRIMNLAAATAPAAPAPAAVSFLTAPCNKSPRTQTSSLTEKIVPAVFRSLSNDGCAVRRCVCVSIQDTAWALSLLFVCLTKQLFKRELGLLASPSTARKLLFCYCPSHRFL